MTAFKVGDTLEVQGRIHGGLRGKRGTVKAVHFLYSKDGHWPERYELTWDDGGTSPPA